ncbi:acyl-coenzyme A synthetase/AMP-(fatty) acid ligase/thioesterase domain-containing protein/acyl carrier protein [Bradyrhizobium elkanii]|uniref:AMP-binding protein n=1 Tax=Bradyrhizobium elkanii TaxID=29448 RepID=UPI003515E15A
MIYTSGTTGAPKAVSIAELAIANQLFWLESEHGLRAGEIVLHKTPASFDAAQWELLAVCCGASVVMGPPGIYRNPSAIVEQIRRHRVTKLQGVPTLLQALVDTPEFEQCTTLDTIFSGGEALTRKLTARIFEALPGCRLVNLYGPTECTINATFYTVDANMLEGAPDMIPIGRPVANTACYVLSEELRELRDGEVGELYIGGKQLAKGYHNREELNSERFIYWIDPSTSVPMRLYKTGDLVLRSQDGVLHFQGRADNQVKLRGYRIELDEIRGAIENHDWVKSAGVFVKPHPRTGQPMLAAGIQLNPREAQLMDQGIAGAHHLSKKSRLQVRAQLSDRGFRSAAELERRLAIELPGSQATSAQRALAFGRKTYRFFEGGTVTLNDLLTFLAVPQQPGAETDGLASLNLEKLGRLMRYLGPFSSAERLLPKYAYASPGALYATQVYLELSGTAGLESGYYYYHPLRHELVQTGFRRRSGWPLMRLHFVGKTSAIEPIYRNNIREVLELETGHILGLLDIILPCFGLGLGIGHFEPDAMLSLSCDERHIYLATYDIISREDREVELPLDIYLQSHGDRVDGLSQGHYVYRAGALVAISHHILEQRHIIAINQRAYQRATGMVSLVSRDARKWHAYIDMGRMMQRLQHNEQRIGLMSSGYSSKSGNDLTSALRLRAILSECGLTADACYTAVFGRISEAQRVHEGMHEDAPHMEGPAELIRNDLRAVLPDYMVPSKIALIEEMPCSASGKIDVNVLKSHPAFEDSDSNREMVAPRNETEAQLALIWREEFGVEEPSVFDDFFEAGGDSLQAVQLVLNINKKLHVNLPVQVLFEAPTIADLARRLEAGKVSYQSSRAVMLRKGNGATIFCWPGLGGYPMSLRHLAAALVTSRAFIGIQASGLNDGEHICRSIEEMSVRDAQMIRQIQPGGPYTLWGYSFGARVAYETAWHFEKSGEKVAELILIAPGSPQVPGGDPVPAEPAALFRDPSFLTILYSVFAQTISPHRVAPLIEAVRNERAFVTFIAAEKPELDVNVIGRITQLVAETYTPGYRSQMEQHELSAPVRLFKARGDNPSFLETLTRAVKHPATIIPLAADHYDLLKPGRVEELVHAIHRQAPT